MIFHETTLKDAMIIEPQLIEDNRGFFSRMMCRDEFTQHGLISDFVQHNMSFSRNKGTVRGLHFQRGAHAEAKLIRCTRGSIADIIVDLRGDSVTYLKHESFVLSAENHHMLYVPTGFAHGFQTLTDNTEVFYPVSAAYTPSAEGGLRYNDPLLGIAWPLEIIDLSIKDASWPFLQQGQSPIF